MGREACPRPPRSRARIRMGSLEVRDAAFERRSVAGLFVAGGHGGAETPVPIPNTAVKGPRGDDTAPPSAGK